MNFKKLIIVLIMFKNSLTLSETLSSYDTFEIKNYLKISFDISIDRAKARTNEYVYDYYYKNYEISKINWKSSNLRLLSGSLNIELPYNFILNINGFTNLNKAKKGMMYDYDKEPNDYAIFNKLREEKVPLYDILFNDIELPTKFYSDLQKNMDWNLSTYSHAVLDRFYGISFDIGKLLIKNKKMELGLGVGYGRNVDRWYSFGGGGIYDYIAVNFYDFRVIEYLNKFKIPYIYVQSIYNLTDKIELSAKFKKSFWVRSKQIDYHILRDIKFFENSSNKNNKYYSIDLKLKYKIKNNLSIFGLYNMNRFSQHKTNSTIFDFIDNNLLFNEYNKNIDGIDARNYYFGLGIKYNF